MRKVREVLRLHHVAGLSARAIARSLKISPVTVRRCVNRAEELGLGWPLPESLDDAQLERRLLRYKQLWMVEQVFRTTKSLLDTRPIFHKTDATICGHVFCSFLVLVLRDEFFRRMDNAGVSAEWGDILRDLHALAKRRLPTTGGAVIFTVEPSFLRGPWERTTARLTVRHISGRSEAKPR